VTLRECFSNLGYRVMNLHPELGYFDEGLDFVEAKIYSDVIRPFGQAHTLPHAAYRSKVFADLEDEKIWTRTWVCIGTQQEIPDEGDILPFTVGNHGIHVQRVKDGKLVGRFNKAQHGGCRSVPLQCQTGNKTKCSFTSCGYSRDRNVLSAVEVEEGSLLGGQYLGDRPERLLPVQVECWGPFIFINLDHSTKSLSKCVKRLSKVMGKTIHGKLDLVYQERAENQCNWKLMGRSFVENVSIPDVKDGYEKYSGVSNQTPMQTMKSLNLSDNYATRDGTLPLLQGISSNKKHKAHLIWHFPNLLLIQMPNYIYSIILQPTGIGLTLGRINLFVNNTAGINQDDPNVIALSSKWLKELEKSVIHGEKLQRDMQNLTKSGLKSSLKLTQKENCPYGYDFQKFIVDSILAKHKYYWSAPLYNDHDR